MGRKIRFVFLASAILGGGAGCGISASHPESMEAGGIPGGGMIIDVEGTPVVDGAGTVWFLGGARRFGGAAISITAVDRTGVSSSIDLDFGERSGSLPVIAPTDHGVLVAAFACGDEECNRASLQVQVLGRTGSGIEAIQGRWRSEATTDADLAMVIPRSLPGGGLALHAGPHLVVTEGDRFEMIDAPPGGEAPCWTSGGELLSAATDGTEGTGPHMEVVPGQFEIASAADVSVLRYDGEDWLPVPESEMAWADVWSPGADMRCAATGPAYGDPVQPASWIWADGWQKTHARSLQWDLAWGPVNSYGSELLGVLEGNLVHVDGASGDILQGISVPLSVRERLDRGRTPVLTPRDDPATGAGSAAAELLETTEPGIDHLALGGEPGDLVGVACWTQDEAEVQTCAIF